MTLHLNRPQIAIVIIESEDLLRECIATSLTTYPQINLVATCSCEQAAEQIILNSKEQIDIVLMGSMQSEKVNDCSSTAQQTNGINFIKKHQRQFAQTSLQFILLTGDDDRNSVLNAFDAGVRGYFIKSGMAGLSILYQAIKEVYNGKLWIDPNIAQYLIDVFLTPPPNPIPTQTSNLKPLSVQVEPLSERELEVLELLAEGKNNREICQTLFIALPTVKSHVSNVINKLETRNRLQAVIKGINLGLIETSNDRETSDKLLKECLQEAC